MIGVESITRIRRISNEKRTPGERTPLRFGHPLNLNGVTTLFSIKLDSVFEGIKDSIVVIVVIDLVFDSVVVRVKLTCEIVAIVDFEPVA